MEKKTEKKTAEQNKETAARKSATAVGCFPTGFSSYPRCAIK